MQVGVRNDPLLLAKESNYRLRTGSLSFTEVHAKPSYLTLISGLCACQKALHLSGTGASVTEPSRPKGTMLNRNVKRIGSERTHDKRIVTLSRQKSTDVVRIDLEIGVNYRQILVDSLGNAMPRNLHTTNHSQRLNAKN